MDAQAFLDIFLEEAEELLQKWENVCLEISDNPEDDSLINELFRYVHTLKGSSKAVDLSDFGGFIHRVEDIIKRDQEGEFDRVLCNEYYLKWQAISASWIDAISSKESFSLDEADFNSEIDAIVKGKTLQQGGSGQKAKKVKEIKKDAKSENAQENKNKKAKNDTIKVSAAKCDKLLRSAGQITMINANLFRIASQIEGEGTLLKDKLSELEKYIEDLYRDALNIRLTPLDLFFTRMQRLAKDVSKQTGKPIDIIIEGREVEIDRTVTDRLIDPFVHIIRNAIDHGIETPDVRKKSGKKDAGTLTIKAKNLSNGVEILVVDDGKGLDCDVLLKKAIEKGLVQPDEKLSDKEIQQLILRPGFSTKEQVSDLSGRGVGMDVVATALVDLGGRISIESQKGSGTTFVLFIPANLTILEAFVTSIGSELYCVLMQEVDEIIDLNEVGTRKAEDSEIVEYRGEVIPIYNMRNIRQLKPDKKPHARPAFLHRTGSKVYAFEVDRILKKQKIMVSDNQDAKGILGFSGVTMMDDAHPGMILSLNGLMQDMQSKAGGF